MEKQPSFTPDIPSLVIGVEGMTCDHCKARVEQGLKKQPHVTRVFADPDKDEVSLYGSPIDTDHLPKVIAELGYTYKGIIR